MEALSVILVVVEGTSLIQNVCVLFMTILVFYDMALFYGFCLEIYGICLEAKWITLFRNHSMDLDVREGDMTPHLSSPFLFTLKNLVSL